jgi:hypothetical protein
MEKQGRKDGILGWQFLQIVDAILICPSIHADIKPGGIIPTKTVCGRASKRRL